MATRPKKPRTTDPGQNVSQQEDELPQINQEAPPRPEKPKSDGSSSFLKAARAGNLDKVLELLRNGKADIATCNSTGLNALHLAGKEGHVDIVAELLGRGADVDASTKKGNTGLHVASLAGQLDVVKILVQNGARINSQSQTGFTPLYMAAQENHVPVVKYLLDKGAAANLATVDGFTPMAVALQQGHNDVVNALMEHSQKGRVRLSALHVAAKKDDVRAATLLLQNNPSTGKGGGIVNETTKSDFTPLHIAAHYGNLNVAKLLIEKEANVNFKAKNGITPLHVSSKWGRENIVQLLLNNNADIECQTRDGLTALHCSARSGHEMVVDMLLQYGASIMAKTRNGLTALHMAAQGDHVECAHRLIFHKAPIDEVTVDYLTPLHVAAHCGNVAVAELLLDNNCQVDARALNGFTPLHIACKKNRIKVIELLLQYGALLNSTTESGLTPLHVASFMGHMEIVIFLLQRGCDPNAVTVRGETSLHLATRGNQTAIMKALLRNGAQVDAKAKEQQTSLHIAARLGAIDCVLVLLEHGASPNATTTDLYTPLHIAAKEAQDEVVQILLDRGAERHRTTSKGFTALHIAAKYGCLRVASVLLKKNANPNIDGKNGLTPLHVAAHYNHPSMVKLLLDQKANPHSVAKNGYTALHIAAKKDEIEVATILLDSGAKTNAESKNGFTPFHLASQEGHAEMVTLLLENKAHVNGCAKNGLTAMHLAAQEDHVPVAEVLVKYNATIDPKTKAGYTPLHTACHFGQLNMIRFLLDHGASVTSVTKLNYTPLHQAAQQGHVLVINILLRYKADPNALTSTGQTPLSIAEHLGYISVVEILKQVTQYIVTSSTTVQYKMLSPEIMHEPAMSDEEDDDVNMTDQSYRYLTSDNMHGYEDDQTDQGTKNRDLFAFEHAHDRRSVGSSVGGRDKIQDDLRYTTEVDELAIESTSIGTALECTAAAATKNGASRRQHLPPDSPPPPTSPDYQTDDMDDVERSIRAGSARAWDDEPVFEQPETLTSVNGQRLNTAISNGGDQDDARSRTRPPALDIHTSKNINGVDIVITGDDTRGGDQPDTTTSSTTKHLVAVSTPLTETLPTPTDSRAAYHSCNMGSESDSRIYGSSSAMSYASSFDPDNVVFRRPIFSGFLVSFLVDARGGAMRGCRHSGIRIIIPPLKVCQPTRITCKLVRRDKLPNPPPLMEGEALASRILLMGPAGAKFAGPVVLEVPHFAALHGTEREIMVLRSENGQTWREHTDVASEQSVKSALCGSFEDLETAEELYHRRITRIIATDFPKYFAIVTRIRQDSVVLGPNGGVMSSRNEPEVKVVFPSGALTKSIKVGLQTQTLPSELVVKTLGSGTYAGPITTIEPRRRKFHRAISVTLPLPREIQSENKTIADTSHLRLLCSITGGTDATEWEDITGSTPMSLTSNSVSFTTSVSARFWLLYCSNHSAAVPMATQLYAEAIVVPFMANFVIFAKRRSKNEAQLRMFCMTDDKMDKTLENHENFQEIARSRDIEVLNGKPQYIEIEGNLVIVQKSIDPSKSYNSQEDKENDKQIYINFRAFRENRRHVNVRSWDPSCDPVGTAIFLSEPPVRRGQVPICTLTVSLNDAVEGRYADVASDDVSSNTADLCQKLEALRKIEFPEEEQISKAQLRLTDIAEYLEKDWILLAKQLDITDDEINKIQSEYRYVVEQALVMLHLWVENNKERATGNALEKALESIHRDDIIAKCIRTVEQVTSADEKRAAKAQLISLNKSAEDLRPSNDKPVEELRSSNDKPAEELRPSNDKPTEDIRPSNDKPVEDLRPSNDKPAEDLRPSNVVVVVPPPPQQPSLSSSNIGNRLDDFIVAEFDCRRRTHQHDEDLDGQRAAEIDSLAYNAAVEQLANQLRDEQVDDGGMVEQEQEGGVQEVPDVARQVIEEELVPSAKTSIPEVKNLESLETTAPDQPESKPAVQTFEDWATQSGPGPNTDDAGRPTQRSSVDPSTGKQTFLETSFEDWVKQREMTTVVEPSAPSAADEAAAAGGQPSSSGGDPRGYEEGAEISREIVEGEMEVRIEMDDGEERLDDGSKVFRQVVVRRQVCPVSEYLLVNGVPTNCQTLSDRLVAVQIEEDLLVLPPGVESADDREDLKTVTEVRETEDRMPDGTPVSRKVTTTRVVPKTMTTAAAEEDEDERKRKMYDDEQQQQPTTTTDDTADPEVISEMEKQAEQIVSRSVLAALEEVHAHSSLDDDDLPDRNDDERPTLQVFTDTIEGEPEVETDVQEFEETLSDGTVVRRRITKTKQKQTVIKRVVMEGPEDELPTTEEQAHQLLQKTAAAVAADHPSSSSAPIDKDILQCYGDRSVSEVVEDPETSVQEFEETLADGTIVRRKIVTTIQQQCTTERFVVEDGDSDQDFDNSCCYDDDENGNNDAAAAAAAAAAVRSSVEGGSGTDVTKVSADSVTDETAADQDDDDLDSTRIVLKKEIRTQRVMRDGKEETIITENVHVVQEDEPPQELEGAVQNVIDQFMGRSHSGQSSV